MNLTHAIILVVIIVGLWAVLGGKGNLARRFVDVLLRVAMYRLARLMLNAALRR